MSRPRPSRWGAVLVGVATTLTVLIVLAAVGLGIEWLTFRGATRANRALAALLWVGAVAILAFAAGGWAAARTAGHRPRGGPPLGLATGVVALLLLLTLAETLVGKAADFGSVGVALGVVDVAPRDPAALPAPVATAVAAGAAPIGAPEIARERTIDAAGYLLAVLVLLLGAAALGGLAGQGGRDAAPPPRHADPDGRAAAG